MKAISLRQPHASLVALGLKRNETRSWATNYRGPLAIHASARMSREEGELCWRDPFFRPLHKAGLLQTSRNGRYEFRYLFPFGAVIAVCNLVDILETNSDGLHEIRLTSQQLKELGMRNYGPRKAPLPSEPEFSFGDYTPGRYAWILTEIKALPEPIPAKGHQGLWNWESEAYAS